MLKWVSKIQIIKLLTNTKMTHVMCSPWKSSFTLVPLNPFTMFSPWKPKFH